MDDYYKTYRKTNREKLTQRAREYRAANNTPEQRAKLATRQKAYRQKNAEHIREMERASQAKNQDRLVPNRLAYLAKGRADKANLPYNIDPDYVKSIWPKNNCCPVFGTLFKVNKHASKKCTSATLDRIKPELGYVRGNIVVISGKANRIKNDATLSELQRVVSFLEQLTG